jgi:hypothetical protein
MIAKYISETTIRPATDTVLKLNGAYISNPTEAHFRQAGYKDVVVEAEPVYDAETQMLVPTYTDGEVITQSWTVVAKPPVPVTPPSLEERVDACEYMLIDMLNFM